MRAVVHLKTSYTKGGKTRDVFASSPALRRVLEKYGERDLGCSKLRRASGSPRCSRARNGGALTPSSMARFLKALYGEAGIAGASSHSGRRTLITRLAERGVDLKAIAEIAGHTSIRTTAHTLYIESNPRRLAARIPAGHRVVENLNRRRTAWIDHFCETQNKEDRMGIFKLLARIFLGEFGLLGKFIADKIDGEPGTTGIEGVRNRRPAGLRRILYQKRDEAGRIWQTVYTSDVDSERHLRLRRRDEP